MVTGNRGPPPPFITPEPPLRTAPLQDPPSYATANPSVKADRPAPPMARNFVDGLGYTVHRNDTANAKGNVRLECAAAVQLMRTRRWEALIGVCLAEGGMNNKRVGGKPWGGCL